MGENETEYSPLETLLDASLVFNDLAGAEIKTLDDLNPQIRIIAEEFQELANGIVTENPEEILDGAIDLYVTAVGMLYNLDQLGFDVNKAALKIAENNLSKFPTDPEVVTASLRKYDGTSNTVHAEFNPDHGKYVIKNQNRKVMKPAGFVPVDLSDCLPLQYRKETDNAT